MFSEYRSMFFRLSFEIQTLSEKFKVLHMSSWPVRTLTPIFVFRIQVNVFQTIVWYSNFVWKVQSSTHLMNCYDTNFQFCFRIQVIAFQTIVWTSTLSEKFKVLHMSWPVRKLTFTFVFRMQVNLFLRLSVWTFKAPQVQFVLMFQLSLTFIFQFFVFLLSF